MKSRVTVVAMMEKEEGKFLIAKMPKNRGVFPGEWAIVGGEIEAGEAMREALVREVKEEVGLEVVEAREWYFRDDWRVKLYEDGRREKQYLIYLVFKCRVRGEVRLNEEFEDFAWVSAKEALEYDLNEATRKTFERWVREKQEREILNEEQEGEGDESE